MLVENVAGLNSNNIENYRISHLLSEKKVSSPTADRKRKRSLIFKENCLWLYRTMEKTGSPSGLFYLFCDGLEIIIEHVNWKI